MISRFFLSTKKYFVPVLAAIIMPATVWADDGPDYTFFGASYEWTDVKYAANPSGDSDFNNGSFEGVNIQGSLGILSWAHLYAEYFTGDCANCGDGSTDIDFDGFQVGLGANYALTDNTDIIVRGAYVDAELGNGLEAIDDDGWAFEANVRRQISERAEVQIGYEYQEIGNTENRDLTIGLAYRVWDGIALTANGIIFDDDSGFDLGIRWYFGDLAFGGRDHIVP